MLSSFFDTDKGAIRTNRCFLSGGIISAIKPILPPRRHWAERGRQGERRKNGRESGRNGSIDRESGKAEKKRRSTWPRRQMACDSHVIAAAPFELKMPTSSQTGLLLIRTSAELLLLLLLLWVFFFQRGNLNAEWKECKMNRSNANWKAPPCR